MAIRQPLSRRSTGGDEWFEHHGRAMPESAFLALDEAEETDLEYYDGATWEKGLVDRDHGVVTGQFVFAFEVLARSSGGEQGPERRVLLPNGRYLKPDAAYWLPGIPSGNDSLPTVAVEVRSPDQTMASQRRKCRLYREAGIPVCWLIDPISRTAEVFEGETDAEPLALNGVLRSDVLAGFALPTAELWAALDR